MQDKCLISFFLIPWALYYALRTKKNLCQCLVKNAREDFGKLWSSLANAILKIYANFIVFMRRFLKLLNKIFCLREHFSKI